MTTNKKMSVEETILYLLDKAGPISKNDLEFLLYRIDFTYFEKHNKPFFKGIKWVKGKYQPKLKKK